MLKVGLLGVGGISGTHIPAWQKLKNAELVALCDIRPEQMTDYSCCHCYTEFDEMLAKENLDILDICLPTYLHVDYALKAIAKGIHVLCEKPLSLNPDDVQRIAAAAEKNNVKFMVAQVLRFWPEYRFLKETYENGSYGKLLSGTMQRLSSIPVWSWDGWLQDKKRSGRILFDLHIHDLDFAVWTFGTPKNVIANRAETPTQDYLSATYQYDDFFIHIESAWYAAPQYPFSMSFRFQFERGVISLIDNQLLLYDDQGNVFNASATAENSMGKIQLPQTDAYANEIAYFADCVQKNKPIEVVQTTQIEAVLNILKSQIK